MGAPGDDTIGIAGDHPVQLWVLVSDGIGLGSNAASYATPADTAASALGCANNRWNLGNTGSVL